LEARRRGASGGRKKNGVIFPNSHPPFKFDFFGRSIFHFAPFIITITYIIFVPFTIIERKAKELNEPLKKKFKIHLLMYVFF
jgi:hypothetical protein